MSCETIGQSRCASCSQWQRQRGRFHRPVGSGHERPEVRPERQFKVGAWPAEDVAAGEIARKHYQHVRAVVAVPSHDHAGIPARKQRPVQRVGREDRPLLPHAGHRTGGARQSGARPYVTLYPGETIGEPTTPSSTRWERSSSSPNTRPPVSRPCRPAPGHDRRRHRAQHRPRIPLGPLTGGAVGSQPPGRPPGVLRQAPLRHGDMG